MNSTTFRKGRTPWNKGKKGSQVAWNKGIQGQVAWNKGLAPKLETREKIRLANLGKKHSLETRKKMSDVRQRLYSGENNPNWKGGTTPLNNLIRASLEYKLWRESVFKRDGWTCIWCGSKKELQADHIKKFADYPELRFAIDNGRTLCLECHKKTDTYLNKSRLKR